MTKRSATACALSLLFGLIGHGAASAGGPTKGGTAGRGAGGSTRPPAIVRYDRRPTAVARPGARGSHVATPVVYSYPVRSSYTVRGQTHNWQPKTYETGAVWTPVTRRSPGGHIPASTSVTSELIVEPNGTATLQGTFTNGLGRQTLGQAVDLEAAGGLAAARIALGQKVDRALGR
jgi:hypothetical protein